MVSDNSEYFKTLEAAARRPYPGDGVLHPDHCDKVTLQGVPFAVQPLAPGKGVRFTPQFAGDSVDLSITVNDGAVDKGLAELAEEVTSAMPLDEGEKCPKCGRALGGDLVVDLEAHKAWMCTVATYAAAILRKQYTLTDQQLDELLAFDGDGLPPWVMQCIRHALGLPTVAPRDVPTAGEFLNRIMPTRASQRSAASQSSKGKPVVTSGPEPATQVTPRRRSFWRRLFHKA